MTNIFPSCQSHHATTLSSFLGSYAASVSLLNARLPRLRQKAVFCARSLLWSFEAISRNAPYSTARSSPVRSTRPDFRTSPPSSIRCLVRSRRFTTHSRVSCLARCASSRCLAAIARRTAFCIAARFARRLVGCAPKKCGAALAPALLLDRVGSADHGQQSTGQRFHVERVGASGNNQVAELAALVLLERLGLVG